MKIDIKECLIWKTPATEGESFDSKNILLESPRTAGKYEITPEALLELKNGRYPERDFPAKMTTWLVDERKSGNVTPLITTETLRRVKGRRTLSIDEKINRFLLYCYNESKQIPWRQFILFPKGISNLKNDSYYFLCAQIELIEENTICTDLEEIIRGEEAYEHLNYYSPNEVSDFIDLVKDQKLIELINSNEDFIYIKLTFEGIQRLEKYLTTPNKEKNQAFVAMCFDERMKNVYESAISPAIEDMKFKPMRIDKKEHINKIDDEIIAEIKRSKFLIADFTPGVKGISGGVYYEAGFADGLGIPVIRTCNKKYENEIHFDTRQYNHILWEDGKDLKEKLKNRIGALYGDGDYLDHEEWKRSIAKEGAY